jgi:AraC-like DNA-binding protein
MELLYQKEHTSCYQYSHHDAPLIEHLQRPKDTVLEWLPADTLLLFLVKGDLLLSYGEGIDRRVGEGTILLLSAKTPCVVKTTSDLSAMIIRLRNKLNFREYFPVASFYRRNRKSKSAPQSLRTLKINAPIEEYLHLLVATMNDGLKCGYFFQLKQKEILYYLRTYYSKHELQAFFAQIMDNDIGFSEMIYGYMDKVNSVEELATLTDYSLSGLKKRFQKVFGMPAQRWMAQEKAKKIYHEINCSTKTFKELSAEFHFSSPSHFDHFCKKNFGTSPGKLRGDNWAKMKKAAHNRKPRNGERTNTPPPVQ